MEQQTENEHASQEPLIVIASNRGPYSFRKRKDGTFASRRGEGGLVTALAALAQKHDVLWVAAALSKDDQEWAAQQVGTIAELDRIRMQLVTLNPRQYRAYYNVISNPLLWFIQHKLWDSPRDPVINSETWAAWREGYVPINQRFADAIADALDANLADPNRPVIVFPQDYHLYLVPHFLRARLGNRVQIQPFIHIPWPGPDEWRVLPAEIRSTLLESLLESDRIGFQTSGDAFNFVQTCRIFVDSAHSRGSRASIEQHGRVVEAKSYPISIDVEKVEALAQDEQTKLFRQQFQNALGENRLILRIDRIEPSKNILRGFLAFREMLTLHPEHRGKVQMLALLVPSRMEVAEYQSYLQEIMAVAGLINADFSDGFWEPTRIIIGNNYPRAIAAMQLYDALLVNPIADGMNLVAKEGPLVNERDGVLVLSELAGAFYELGKDALTISPYDVYSTAEALHQALTMPQAERAQRAQNLREQVRHAGVRDWFNHQVEDALKAWESHSSSASTPGTPATSKSALS
jgi:trehalose 6-phosphate synthase